MTQMEMLKRVQVVDFTLLEAHLFLDSHPDNKMALEYYKKHLAQAQTLRQEYEDQFGPLEAKNGKADTWNWIADPWPWENLGRYA